MYVISQDDVKKLADWEIVYQMLNWHFLKILTLLSFFFPPGDYKVEVTVVLCKILCHWPQISSM